MNIERFDTIWTPPKGWYHLWAAPYFALYTIILTSFKIPCQWTRLYSDKSKIIFYGKPPQKKNTLSFGHCPPLVEFDTFISTTFQRNRLLFRWWMDHDLGENQSAFSISLFCLDDWTGSNLTLVKNLESISFVSPLWKPMRRMKTPWKRNRKMYKKFVGFTNWHESRVSGLGWNLTRDWGNQNASFFCNTCHSIDNAESVGFQDIAERTRDKSNLHPK